VWAYDLTRFSRKIIEGERLVELAGKGIRVWAMAGEYDLTTADGRRAFRESMVSAAAESDKISERVKRGKLRRARKGRSSTGARSYAMPGYLPREKDALRGDPRVLVTDEQVAAERAIVIECYTRLLAGEGLSTVVTDLNVRGVRGMSGGRWSRGHLSRMLQRPALAGLLVHNGQIMGEIAGVEPVVDRALWERLCAYFEGRKVGRPSGQTTASGITHFLSGMFLCASCGWAVRGGSRAASLNPYPDGAPRREYRCYRTADHPGCGRNHIDARVAEQAVDVAMRARLGDPRRAARIAEHLSQVSQQRTALLGEISTLEESADQIATRTAAWGMERVDKAMGPLMARLDVLRAQVNALESPEQAHSAAADAVQAWETASERQDYPAMRTMLKRTFPHLTLNPPARYNDHSPTRIEWEPTELTARSEPIFRH
jgi:site-specific DNA recombinase